MHFVENEEWNWETLEDSNQASNQQKLNFPVGSVKGQRNQDWQNEMVDNIPVRGTKLLYDIYHRCNIAVCEPAGFEEAKMDKKWMVAMKEELHMIEKNKTWLLVDKPQDRKVIGVKLVFRTKLNVDGSINKHKARLVV